MVLNSKVFFIMVTEISFEPVSDQLFLICKPRPLRSPEDEESEKCYTGGLIIRSLSPM